ncbi:MAG: outer membrane family protein [Micavibrio aeruginosavorus]|uniref:Outer membrane family protein n=1 Tax=Micavibrio aeruginosavorus TaxID=349221 RepID=A0A2W5N2C0_9BACT|nr:MAG: outer membrane family protein [Micavibrio aeruginosavorus]
MIHRAFLTAVAALFALTLFAPAPAKAADAPTIGIVDVEYILAQSKAAQSLQKQIQAKKEAFQKEFSAKEKELKTTENSLLAEQGKVTAEEFAKKRKAYEEKIIETQKLFKKRRGALDDGLANAMKELRKNIVEATTAVASEKKYDIVVTRESVLIAEKNLDITPEVLKALDAKITDIKLTVQ